MSLHQQSGTARIVLPVALACMAAGFTLGWWFGGEQRDGAREDRRVRPAIAVGLASSGHPPKPETEVGAAAATRLFQGPAATERKAAQAQFRDALRSMDRLERMKNMLVVLDKMTPENGQAYLDGWLDFVNQNGPPYAESPLFDRKIGEVLGPVVVGRRTGTAWDMNRVRDAVREQFIGWMQTDPVAAKGWMDGLQNEPFREQLVDAYVAAIAQKDLNASLTFLKGLPEDLQAQSAGIIVSAAKAEKSQAELGVWMNDIVSQAGERKDAPWLRATYDAMMQNLASARMCGESAVAIYERHQGQPYSDSQWGIGLAGAYARSDTTAGLAWAAKMAATDPGMIDAAVAGVQPEKLNEALQWSQTPASGQWRDQLLTKIAQRLEKVDPAKAAEAKALISGGQR